MTSTPLRSACSCGPIPTPPITTADVTGVWVAIASSCSTICAASSRVGVSTSARVVPRGREISLLRIGRRNAAVLPLPVDAQARRSFPCIAGGIASAWIGVGRRNPISLIPFTRLGSSSNFEKGTLCVQRLPHKRRAHEPEGVVRAMVPRKITPPAQFQFGDGVLGAVEGQNGEIESPNLSDGNYTKVFCDGRHGS